MSESAFGRDVFIALAAVAWADGTVDPDEADAIVRAAIEEATRKPVPMSAIEKASLTKDDRLFVYGIACWIARLDGRVTDEESTALTQLGERLEIPERARAGAEKRAAEVAALPEGDRPARYDLDRLRSLLRV